MIQLKDYMTQKQVAKKLEVHADTVRRWTRAGKLETLDYPGRTRYNRKYIEELTK